MTRVVAASRVVWPVIILFIIAQAVFVAAYVGHERTIYFWDHAMYFNMARQTYEVFSQNLSAGWAMLRTSLADNYNLIFTLPSVVTFSLFGTSRVVFIVSNFFAFFLVYEISVAFLLRRSLGLGWETSLIVSLIAASLTPPLWLPLLEGYPDNGAAACLVLAAAIGWSGAGKARFIRRAIGVGVALGLAVLLRRHFVYPAFALLGTLGCLEIWDIARMQKSRWSVIRRTAIYFLISGISFAAVLDVVAPEFVQTALTTDFGSLYISYQRPALVFLRFILGGFGFGLLLIAGDGLFLLARRNETGRKLAVFAALFVLLWLIIWCLGPDQMGHHYILHALPLGIAVGLAGWFVHLSNRHGKYIVGGLIIAGLAANSAWALWFSPTGVWPNDNGTPGLLSAPRPPVLRSDYDEWHRLAAYLQRTTKPDDRIMIVGSSFVLNLDLLHSVFVDLPGAEDMIARFPKNPEIDHEEPAPFDVFAGSNVYVVPTPPQYHLDPTGQRVITAAANQFLPPAPRANMFHADNEAFHLADGVTVKIWRRDAWTPASLHDALAEIRRDGPDDAKFNQGWAAVSLPLRDRIVTDANNITSAAGLLDSGHREMRLFFDFPLEAGKHRVAYSYATDCADPRFHLKLETGGGQTEIAKDAPAFLERPDTVSWEFPAAKEGGFLEIDFSSTPAALCRVELQGLRVEKIP